MLRINCTINGVTPILMHRFSDEEYLKNDKSSGKISGVAQDRGTMREQAKVGIYFAEDGETVVAPTINLLTCLINAGKFFKIGRNKVTTMKTSLLPGVLFFDKIEFPLIHDGWEVDKRSVVIPATGGRIIRYRPMFDPWAIKFDFLIDTDEINEKFARDLVDAAGKKIGLFDFRPERKGFFGRFVVTQWAVEKEEPSIAEMAAA